MTKIDGPELEVQLHHKNKQQKLEQPSSTIQARGSDVLKVNNQALQQRAVLESNESAKDPVLAGDQVDSANTTDRSAKKPSTGHQPSIAMETEVELSDGSHEGGSSRPPSDGEYDPFDESELDESDDKYFCHSNGNSDYDASIFVRSPISASELKVVAGKVKSAFEKPLRRLELEGYHAYKQHVEQVKVKDELKKKKDDERLQQALAESKIVGNPREYQYALFEIAKKKNIVVNLGTGCGKTLIAVLLINYFSPSFEDHKQVLFMVPSVALAVQHTSTLRANLPFSVETACCNTKFSEKSRRKLATCNIIVATHGAIHDLLMHYGDLFRMDRFSLLVVDECHYAYGRHPYCLVMNDFYHKLPKEARPRVLGLTASPIVNVKEGHSDKHLDETLAKLESTLDASVTSIFGLGLEDTEKFNLMLKCADEKDIVYDKFAPTCEIPSFENIGLHHGRIREFRQLEVLFNELGPKVLSIYCRTLAREVSCNSFEKETPDQYTTAVDHLLAIAQFADQLCQSCPRGGRSDKLLALEELLEQQIEHASGPDTVGLVFVERRITALALSDFFRHRTEQLHAGTWVRAHAIRQPSSSLTSPRKRRREDGLSDDFVNDGQYDDATESEEMLLDQTPRRGRADEEEEDDDCQYMDAYEPFFEFIPSQAPMPQVADCKDAISECDNVDCVADSIRCGVLVRNSTNIFKSLNSIQSMNKVEQTEVRKTWLHQETKIRETLNKLRRKEINVLIATSVVEEGVDVQACSFVAVFDAIKSTKAYIQMKGRARQEDAKFFVFQAKDTYGKGCISLLVAQEMEQRVHKFLATRVPVINEPTEQKNDYFGQSLSWELQALESLAFATAYGRVDLNTSKSLVNRYALSVPMDPFARSSKEMLLAHLPVYEGCQLFLPSHLPREMRVVTLPERHRTEPSKKQRESLLALMACARLYSNGLLNDRLLPLTKDDMRKRILQVASQELPEIPFYPRVLGEMSEAFIYVIEQSSPVFNRSGSILNGEGRRLALVTTHPLSLDFPTIPVRHRQLGKVDIELTSAGKVNLGSSDCDTLLQFFLLLVNTRWRRKTQAFYFRARQDGKTGVVEPYLIGLVTAENALDWACMKVLLADSRRTMEERVEAVRSQAGSMPMSSPRLWTPVFDPNVVYVAYGPTAETCVDPFPFKKEGIRTYKEYFKVIRDFEVEPSSRRFEVQRCWNLPVKLKSPDNHADKGVDHPPFAINSRTSCYRVCEELPTVRLPRDACYEPPLADPFIYLSCVLLPHVMYIVERHVSTKAFITHCVSSLPTLGACLGKLPIEKVQEALSAKSCCLDLSFEKLEWLGDAVLKLVQTHSLLHSIDLHRWIPFLHEGDLSSLRSAMGCNDRLEMTCKQFHFNRFVMTVPLARGQWIPSQLELYRPGIAQAKGVTCENPKVGKVYADVMESLLGLIFLHFGYETVLEVAGELHLTLPWRVAHVTNPYQIKPKPKLLSEATRCTGHTNFSRPELVEEAFTHSSAMHPEVASYQRLEWAGDAVLCLTVRERIFRQFCDVSLGEMVVMEAALVANETLAYISVKNGLPKLINHRDQSLPGRIENYDWCVKELGRGLWGTDPPKVISDVVESLIGAVYVDAGFSSGRNAINHLLDPVFQHLAKPRSSFDDIPLKHPKKLMQELGGSLLTIISSTERELATSKTEQLVWHGSGWRKLDPKSQIYVAGIQFIGSDLVLVADSSPAVARSRACAFVVCMLEQEPDLLRRLRTVNSLVERSNMLHDLDDESDEINDELPI